MQLYAVNFIPLLGSLYMFRVFYTPIIRSIILKTVSTATGTDHSIISATYSQRGLQATLGILSANGRQHRRCIIPQTVTHSLVLLKMGKIIFRNVLS